MNSGTKAGEPAERALYLVFEAGGAKGIAHVEALRQIEAVIAGQQAVGEPQLRIAGVAGSSAGAIVAAMVAAGAKADDLIAVDGQVPLTAAMKVDHFKTLLGANGWRRLRSWRGVLTRPDPNSIFEGLRAASLERIGLWIVFGLASYLLHAHFMDAPLSTAGYVLSLAVVLFAALSLSHWLSGWVERRRERRGAERTISGFDQVLDHPVSIFLVAIAVVEGALAAFQFFITGTEAWADFAASIAKYQRVPAVKFWAYAACVAFASLVLVVYVRLLLKGAVNTDRLRRDINRALAVILTHEHVAAAPGDPTISPWRLRSGQEERFKVLTASPGGVKFSDLRQDIPLFIVAADAIRNQPRVFSTTSSTNESVADAVAASIAIPLLFRPVRAFGSILFDGGIISAAPAWVFRRYRALDPDARVIVIGLADDNSDTWLPDWLERRRKALEAGRFWTGHLWALRNPVWSFTWPWRQFINIAYTWTFGSRTLDLDAGGQLEEIRIVPQFNLLDFHRKPIEVRRELDEVVRPQVDFYLRKMLVLASLFEAVGQEIESQLQTALQKASPAEPRAKFRIFLATNEPMVPAVRMNARYGFDDKMFDDRLLLPFDSSLAGRACATNEALFIDRTVARAMFGLTRDRYRKAAKWNGVEWCWCLPMTDGTFHLLDGQPRIWVLAIECGTPIERFGTGLAEEAKRQIDRWSAWTRLDISERYRSNPFPLNGATPIMLEYEDAWRNSVAETYIKKHNEAPPQPSPVMAELAPSWEVAREAFLRDDPNAILGLGRRRSRG